MADERITTREISDDDIEDRLLAALRARGGQGSETDLVVASGLAPHQVGPGLRRLVVDYRSHMDVRSDGTLIYRFDPRFIRRSARPGVVLRTALRVLWGIFVVGFKILAGLVLLGYVGIFALLLFALLAGIRVLGILKPLYESIAAPNRLRRAWGFVSTNLQRTARIARAIFNFTFGPPPPKYDEFADERDLLALARARLGVLSPGEIVAHTGWTADKADEESTRLVARYNGDVEFEDGRVVFVFPDLMGSPGAPAPPPCWERLEDPVDVTGNERSTDGIVVALHLWVLVAATFLFPTYIANEFDIPLESPDVRLWMIYLPTLYVLGSFGIHLLRRRKIAGPENQRRLLRNIRRLILRELSAGRPPYPLRILREMVDTHFPLPPTLHTVQEQLFATATDLNAEVPMESTDPERIRWNEFAGDLAAAAARRARVPRKAPGEVIFSSEDPPTQPVPSE